MFVLLLCCVLLILFLYNFKSIRRHIVILQHLHRLPGPPTSTNPLFGNIESIYSNPSPENIFKVVRAWSSQYYPIYYNWMAHYALANVINPYDLEIILCNMKHIEKTVAYDIMHKWIGTGLLTSTGTKWQKRRKILTNSFHFNILQDFIEIFNQETEKLVQVFKKECYKPFIPVDDYISQFTLNTIGETAMGTNFDQNSVKEAEYKTALHKIGEMYLYRFLRPWLLNSFLYVFSRQYWSETRMVKILHTFTTTVISKREKNFKPVNLDSRNFSYSRQKRLAMLDLLLTEKTVEGSIDNEGIREEVDTFVFEGHDTTAVAIGYALMLIACHRQVQDQIVEEMREVLRDVTTPDYKALQELKYMERCIKEVLRMYPSVPFIARLLGEDITTYSGHKLKAGTMVHMYIYDVHHNPEFYPEPEKFDPDRFLPEMCQNRHIFAYIPFSAGPRNCIGQKFAFLELKAMLVGILSEFILEPVDTPSSVVLMQNLVLRNRDPIRIKFVPRASPVLKKAETMC